MQVSVAPALTRPPQAFVHATGATDTDKWVGTTVAGAAIVYTPA